MIHFWYFYFSIFLIVILNNSSAVHIFYELEDNMIDMLDLFIKNEEQRLEDIERTSTMWKVERSKYLQDMKGYVLNPLQGFRLIKGLTTDLLSIENVMKTNSFKDLETSEMLLPTAEDLHNIIMTIVKLQETYSISPNDIVRGNIGMLQFNSTLTYEDCILIATTCKDNHELRIATEWFKQCLRYNKTDEFISIYATLAELNLILNEKNAALNYVLSSKKGELHNRKAHQLELEILNDISEERARETTIGTSNYVCLHGSQLSPEISSKLKCQYKTSNAPFLKLAPLKEETLYLNPDIYIYHHVLSDNEIQDIINTSLNQLVASTVLSIDGKKRLPDTFYRTSHNTFLNKHAHKTIEKLDLKIEDMTGLDQASSEDIQVLNYGPGGYYFVHSDFLPAEMDLVKRTGNRMATVLFYLNDVPIGGGTAFPKLNLLVNPKKGSVLVWHNVNHDGTINRVVNHLACPVIMGEKWACNKWVHEFGQEFRRPCKVLETSDVKSKLS